MRNYILVFGHRRTYRPTTRQMLVCRNLNILFRHNDGYYYVTRCGWAITQRNFSGSGMCVLASWGTAACGKIDQSRTTPRSIANIRICTGDLKHFTRSISHKNSLKTWCCKWTSTSLTEHKRRISRLRTRFNCKCSNRYLQIFARIIEKWYQIRWRI